MPIIIISAGLFLGLLIMLSGVGLSIAMVFLGLAIVLAIRDSVVRNTCKAFVYLRQLTIGTQKLSRDEIMDVVVSRLKANEDLARLGHRVEFRTGYVEDSKIYNSGPERYPQTLCQIILKFNQDVYNNLCVVRYVSIDKNKRIHIWKVQSEVWAGPIEYRSGMYNSTFDPLKMDRIAIKQLNLAKSERVEQIKREEMKALLVKKEAVRAQKDQEKRRSLMSRLLK